MNNKTEGALAIIAAILVLFSSMFDPTVSFIISIAALVGFGVFHLTIK